MAVRLGASDVVALAKFYDAAFGLKEIDRVGNPATEIIMRFGATVAEAKAGASPEFLVQKREALRTTQCTTRSSAYLTSPRRWPPRRLQAPRSTATSPL
jgi:hypothetical protein